MLYMNIGGKNLRLDLKENVVFPFSDPAWVGKILKTTISYLLIFTIPAVVGYQLAVIREAANGEDETLPEFGPNFGNMWVKGCIVSLMICVLMFVPMGLFGTLAFGGAAVMQNNEAMALSWMVILALAFFALCFVIGIMMPALMLRYAMTDSVSSLFDLRAAFNDIKQGPGDYAMVVLFPILASFVSTLVSATGIGVILVLPLTVLTMIIQGRLMGNYYRAYFQ